jgi:uncharacterized membrane protein YeaQ/YmgE (transglycosylase-associated protein family)
LGGITGILACIVGAVVGGLIFKYLGSRGITGFNWWSLLVAFVGALIVLLFVRLLAALLKE